MSLRNFSLRHHNKNLLPHFYHLSTTSSGITSSFNSQTCNSYDKPLVSPRSRFSSHSQTRRKYSSFKPFLTKRESYEEVVKNFKWNIPSHYNIGVDICDKHAINETWRDKTALIYDQNDGSQISKVSFSQLKVLTDQLCNALVHKLGVRPQDRIGVLLTQSIETALAHISTYKCGAIAVPLFVLFGPEALSYRLNDSGATTLFTNEECLPKLLQIRDELPQLKNIVLVRTKSGNEGAIPVVNGLNIVDFWDVLLEGSKSFESAKTKADDPALIIYTSGTTGPPKGCLHAHRVLLGHMPGVEFPQNFFPQANDLFWTPADWAWIGGLIDVLLPSLHHGIPVLANRSKKFDPEECFHLMQKHSVRNVFLPPTALKLMRNVPNPKQKYNYDLRSIGSGGESLGENILDWGRDTFGIEINEFYGQTEMNLLVGNCYQVLKVRPGSMGRAIPGRVVEILDEHGNVCKPGERGVVGAKKDAVTFLKYWNNQEATRKKFTEDGEYLITGDLAVKDENGYFYFVGREDDVINSAGYRIGPSEIEDCLMKHKAVAVCAAVGSPDEIRNEVVKAFIILKSDYKQYQTGPSSESLVKDIQEFVKQKLAAHEYPRRIEFVEELPMTTTGKIQRNVLRKQEYEKYKGQQ